MFYKRIILIIIIYIFSASFTGCYQHSADEKITVIFRYDDVSASSPVDIELKLIEAFRAVESSITIGVIPFRCAGNTRDPSPKQLMPLTPTKKSILKQGYDDGILDIALHGYSHQTYDAEQITEFSGLDYSIQLEKIAKGKKFLEDIIQAPVTTFIPPWNSYDLNTIFVLEKLGFSILSAGKGGLTTKDSKLKFMPATCGLPGLQEAIETSRKSAMKHDIIIVLFHGYDFIEGNKEKGIMTIREFSDILCWLNSQKDICISSISCKNF